MRRMAPTPGAAIWSSARAAAAPSSCRRSPPATAASSSTANAPATTAAAAWPLPATSTATASPIWSSAHRMATPAAGSNAGRSYVIFGRSGSTAIDLSAIAAGNGGFVINGQSANDWSGWPVAGAGDVNGDGLADLIVGARQSDPASRQQCRAQLRRFRQDRTAAPSTSRRSPMARRFHHQWPLRN
jgi:hypothetical protein